MVSAAQRRVLHCFLARAKLGVHEITPEYANMKLQVIHSLLRQGYLQPTKLGGPTRLIPMRLTNKGRIVAEKLEVYGGSL